MVTADELGPVGEGNSRGDDEADVFMECGKTTEEQIRSRLGKGDKPDFIEDDEVEPE